MTFIKRYNVIIIITCSIIVSFFITLYFIKHKNMEGSHIKELNDDKTEIVEVSNIKEIRELKMSAQNDYIIDVNKMAYKTDGQGNFEAILALNYNISQDEKVVIYAYLKDSKIPIEISINGKSEKYHIIEVPKSGGISLDLKISNVPDGENLVYLFTEKYFGDFNEAEDLDKRLYQTFVSSYYFNLEGKQSTNDLTKKQDDYLDATIIKPVDRDDGNHFIKIFEDENLLREAEVINEGTYYIAISNKETSEIRGDFQLLSNYDVVYSEKYNIPSSSTIVVPMNIDRNMFKESIKARFLGYPAETDNSVEFPIRVRQFSPRIPAGD